MNFFKRTIGIWKLKMKKKIGNWKRNLKLQHRRTLSVTLFRNRLLFFSYILLPRWNCKLYKRKMKKLRWMKGQLEQKTWNLKHFLVKSKHRTRISRDETSNCVFVRNFKTIWWNWKYQKEMLVFVGQSNITRLFTNILKLYIIWCVNWKFCWWVYLLTELQKKWKLKFQSHWFFSFYHSPFWLIRYQIVWLGTTIFKILYHLVCEWKPCSYSYENGRLNFKINSLVLDLSLFGLILY